MERNVQNPNQTTRRKLLRGAALGGTGIATASLLAPGNASAADAGNGLVFPGVDVVIDASHATTEVAALVRSYLTVAVQLGSAGVAGSSLDLVC